MAKRISKSLPSIVRLKELFDYNPDTGVFRHRIAKKGRWNGAIAGYNRLDGYQSIRVDGKRYLGHRLAWLFYYGEPPSDDIDHINRIPSDNRIINLRLANTSQNRCNAVSKSYGKSGLKGVRFNDQKKCWRAVIQINKKSVFLGDFKTKIEAAAAYLKASAKYHKEYACVNYRIINNQIEEINNG